MSLAEFILMRNGEVLFLIRPARIADMIREMAALGIFPENAVPDEFLMSLAGHEVRHCLVERGYIRPFLPDNLSQLHNFISPPEEVERYIAAYNAFMTDRMNDPLEGDAHMVEMIIYDIASQGGDVEDIISALLISPEEGEKVDKKEERHTEELRYAFLFKSL